MSQLTVSLSPHVRSGATTRRIMLDVCLALLPAVIFAVYWFGFGVLLTVLLSVASAILSEFLMEKALRRPVTIDVRSLPFASQNRSLAVWAIISSIPRWRGAHFCWRPSRRR